MNKPREKKWVNLINNFTLKKYWLRRDKTKNDFLDDTEMIKQTIYRTTEDSNRYKKKYGDDWRNKKVKYSSDFYYENMFVYENLKGELSSANKKRIKLGLKCWHDWYFYSKEEGEIFFQEIIRSLDERQKVVYIDRVVAPCIARILYVNNELKLFYMEIV